MDNQKSILKSIKNIDKENFGSSFYKKLKLFAWETGLGPVINVRPDVLGQQAVFYFPGRSGKLSCPCYEKNGQILLEGRTLGRERTKSDRRALQMVFQNPVPSFDPRHTLADGIGESLRNAGVGKDEARARAVSLLKRCGLPEELADRYPRDVSGGQCQRAAIARALACDPALIILDEATSALDVTVQAQIVELLRDIRRERSATFLFICHDLALVQGFCDRVLVMRAGRIVEQGPAASVIAHPRHEYTCQLVDAVLSC